MNTLPSTPPQSISIEQLAADCFVADRFDPLVFANLTVDEARQLLRLLANARTDDLNRHSLGMALRVSSLFHASVIDSLSGEIGKLCSTAFLFWWRSLDSEALSDGGGDVSGADNLTPHLRSALRIGVQRGCLIDVNELRWPSPTTPSRRVMDLLGGHGSVAIPLVDAVNAVLRDAAAYLAQADTDIRVGSHTVHSRRDFWGRFAATPLIERACFALTLLGDNARARDDIQQVLIVLASRSADRGGSQPVLTTLLTIWPEIELCPTLQERAEWLRVFRAHASNVIPLDMLPVPSHSLECTRRTERTLRRLRNPEEANDAAKHFFTFAVKGEVDHDVDTFRGLLAAARDSQIPAPACSWVLDSLNCMMRAMRFGDELGTDLAVTVESLIRSGNRDGTCRAMRLLRDGAPETATEPVLELLRRFVDGTTAFPKNVAPSPWSVLATLQARK